MKKGVSMCFIIFRDVLPATGAPGLRRFPRRLDQWAHLWTIFPAKQTRKPQKSNGTQRSFSGAQNSKICHSDTFLQAVTNLFLKCAWGGIAWQCVHLEVWNCQAQLLQGIPTFLRERSGERLPPKNWSCNWDSRVKHQLPTTNLGMFVEKHHVGWKNHMPCINWNNMARLDQWIFRKKMQETLTNHWWGPPNSPSNLRPRRQNGVAQQSEV